MYILYVFFKLPHSFEFFPRCFIIIIWDESGIYKGVLKLSSHISRGEKPHVFLRYLFEWILAFFSGIVFPPLPPLYIKGVFSVFLFVVGAPF